MKIVISSSQYELKFLPFAQPEIIPAIKWTRDSAGFLRGSDRGPAQDIYRSKVSFQAKDSDIDDIQTWLNSGDGLDVFQLSNFDSAGQDIFGPHVNYGSTLNAVWDKDYAPRKSVLTNKVSALEIMLRLATIPTLPFGATPSLSSLHLQSGWDGDTLPSRIPNFAYDQTVSFLDSAKSAGEFNGVFVQKPGEARAILAYLLDCDYGRARSFAFPLDSGMVSHPFGVHRTGSFNCVVPEWELSRLNLNRWQFKIKFCEFQGTQTTGPD